MNRLERFEGVVRLSVIPIVASGAILLHHYFEDILRGHPGWNLVLTVLFLAGVISLVEWAIEQLKCIRWIRKNIILREDWIEGVWFDFLIDAEAKGVLGNGLITIRFVDGQLKIIGCGMSSQGVEIAPFTATLIDWSEDGVRFMYKKEGGMTIGMAQYDFRRFGGGKPADYSGWFFESTDSKRQNVVAFLIEEPELLSELGDPTRRRTAVHKLIAMYKAVAIRTG
jgi:hypothetical protein